MLSAGAERGIAQSVRGPLLKRRQALVKTQHWDAPEVERVVGSERAFVVASASVLCAASVALTRHARARPKHAR